MKFPNIGNVGNARRKDENVEDYTDMYDDYYDEKNDYEDNDADMSFVDEADAPKTARREGVSFDSSSNASVSLKVVKPKGYQDGPSIADHLVQGSTVVLNIEDLSREQAIRLIDFLLGAVHVVGGEMKSVTKTTIVFAPRNVGVSEFVGSEESTRI